MALVDATVTRILDADGNRHEVGPHDEFFFFNFRSDRGRELSHALIDEDFAEFDRGNWVPKRNLTTMTVYEAHHPTHVIFAPHDVEYPMARAISDPTLAQRSLGTLLILDHISQVKLAGLSYVYLGYWVKDSPKMAYKGRFRPLEVQQGPLGWRRLD